MKIRLPYVYQAEVILQRKRSPQICNFLGYVEHDMPEVSLDRAPIAVSWDEGVHGTCIVRSVDGTLYEPFAKEVRDANKLTADKLVGDFSPKAGQNQVEVLGYALQKLYNAFFSTYTSPILNGSYKPTPIEDVKEWLSSDEGTQRKIAEAKVTELISIDGILYRKCSNPVLMLHPWKNENTANPSWYHLLVYTGDRAVGSVVDVTQEVRVQRPSVTKFYPLHEWELALSEAADVGVERPDLVSAPTVLINSAADFDRADDIAVRTAEFVLSDIKGRIGDYPRHVVDVWLDLRDSYRALVNSEGSLDDLMRRLEEFAGHLGLDDAVITREIGIGLEAWNDSNIGISVAATPKLRG